MARIPTLSDDAAPPQTAEVFDTIRGRGIEVLNLYRVLGNAPAILRAWVDFAWALRLDAKTPRDLREMMILRGAQIAGAAYEWAHHYPMALAAGVPEQKIHALANWRDGNLFTVEERACLRLTEEIAAGGAASAEAVEELKAYFDPEAVVELTLTASFYVCVSRFLESMGVDIEPDYERYRP
jgi:alkylhydroperoxidase family enzyme